MNLRHYESFLGSEHFETCAKCGQAFDLFEVHLDGDGQFRCLRDSQGPDPATIAEANLLLTDYLQRNPRLVTEIQRYSPNATGRTLRQPATSARSHFNRAGFEAVEAE